MRKHIEGRQILFFSFTFVLAVAIGFLIQYLSQSIFAINPRYNGFNAGDIISDYVMADYTSMDENDIQNFLRSKSSCGDTNLTGKSGTISYGYVQEGNNFGVKYNYQITLNTSYGPRTFDYHVENGHFVCMIEESFNGESAAHIIWQAAQDYHINPKVLIVLLQKEQGLLTDSWPNSNFQYRSATGYGCPDHGDCNSDYYGFRNQIRNAADHYRYILDNGSRYYPVGNNNVLYNPDPGCGSSTVYISNRATAALYQYTPYQPNDAVLNSAHGSTVSCGAYGNLNFYYYYTEWFGDTHGNELHGIYLPDGIYQLRTTGDLALSFEGTNNGDGARTAISNTGDTLQQFRLTRDGKYYRIQNVKSGRYLDLIGNDSHDGSKIQLWDRADGCAQKWLVQNYRNSYRLISSCSSEASTKSLDVSGEQVDIPGTTVHLWASSDTVAQQWRFVNLSPAIITEDTYNLKSTAGKVLTPVLEQHYAGVDMVIWEDTTSAVNRLIFQKAEDGSYRIINAQSGLYLAVYSAWIDDGTNAILYYKDDNTCAQRWIAEENGDGYSLKNSCSNKSLDIDGGAVGTNNRRVQIWSENSSEAQRWYLAQPNTTQAISNGVYNIHSAKRSNLRLDVVGSNEYGNGSNIQVWDRNGSDNQKFIFTYDANTGYYTIASNLDNTLHLDTAGGSSIGNIQLYGANNSCAQQWFLIPTDEYYYIVSACGRTVIDIAGGDTRNGTNVGLWDNLGLANQKWSIVDVSTYANAPLEDGDYTISSRMNQNLVLDIAGGSTQSGTNVGVWESLNLPNQTFKLNYDSGSGYYTIHNEAANQNLDIAGAKAEDGTNLQIWSQNNECAQKWELVKTESDFYRIVSACDQNYSLDIAGAENRAGANVLIWSNHSGANQQWKFNKQ